MSFLCKNLKSLCRDAGKDKGQRTVLHSYITAARSSAGTSWTLWISHFVSKTVRRLIGLVRQSSYWKPRHQTSFRPLSDHRTVRTWILWTLKSGGRWCKKRSSNVVSMTFGESRECIVPAWDELVWLTWQSSGSGELVFTLASRQNTNCLHELWLTRICVHLPYVCCRLPLLQLTAWRRALVFTSPRDFTESTVCPSWKCAGWEIFPTFNVANCEAAVIKV